MLHLGMSKRAARPTESWTRQVRHAQRERGQAMEEIRFEDLRSRKMVVN